MEAGSLSRAAERLLMTQSGVSQHIKDLEHHFGTELFIRERRGVSLTPAGETLLTYAEDLLKLATQAENAVTDVSNLVNQQIQVIATPGISIYLLPEWVQAFRVKYPNLSVMLKTDITSQVIEQVLESQADVGFIEGELDSQASKQIDVRALDEVEQYVVIGQPHGWWGQSHISIDALNHQPFIMRQPTSQSRQWLADMLKHYQVVPKIVAEFDNLESIKRAVIAGDGLTILPLYAIQQERDLGLVQAIALDESLLQRTLKLIWKRGQLFSPVVRAFLREVQVYFPQATINVDI